MNRREGAILEVPKPLERVKVVLVLEWGIGVSWTRPTERTANKLAGNRGGSDRLGRVECDVRNGRLFGDARDRINGEPSDGQGALIDVCEDVIQPLAESDVRQRGVAEEAGNADVEEAQSRARREKGASDSYISRGEEGLLLDWRRLRSSSVDAKQDAEARTAK